METAAESAVLPGYEGLETGVDGDTLLVHIPGIVSEDHCASITTELCRIPYERPGVSKWEVDLSAVANVPFSLAGALGRLREELGDLGCEVRFSRIAPTGRRPHSQEGTNGRVRTWQRA